MTTDRDPSPFEASDRTRPTVSRRAFLATAALGATTLLAGCGRPGPPLDLPEDADVAAENRGSVTIDEGSYHTLQYQPSRSASLAYNVVVSSDLPIDLIVLPVSELPAFRRRGEWYHYGTASTLNAMTASGMHPLPTGDVAVVIDNSARGRAAPPTDFRNNAADVAYSVAVFESESESA